MPYRLLSQSETENACLGWLGKHVIDATSAAQLWAASEVVEAGATDMSNVDGWWRIEILTDAVFGTKTKVWIGHVPFAADGVTSYAAGAIFWAPFQVIDLASGSIEAAMVPNDAGRS
jgi:hypothetical protein